MTRRKNATPADDTVHEGACSTPRRRSSPSSARPGTCTSREVLGTTLEENLRMIADSVAYCKAAGPRGVLRRRAFLRRLQAQPGIRAADAAGGRSDAGASVVDPLRHQRRHAARGDRRARARRCAQALRVRARHPLPQRLRRGRGQLAGRGARRARRRCRARSTASASAAATSISSASSPTSRSSAATRCCSPAACARLTEVSRYVYEIGQHELPHQPAVRRHQRLRPQGRHARARRRRSTGQLRAHRPGRWSATSGASWSASCPGSRTSWPRRRSTQIDHDKALMAKILDQVQDLENAGLRVRGGRGVVRPAGQEGGRACTSRSSSG